MQHVLVIPIHSLSLLQVLKFCHIMFVIECFMQILFLFFLPLSFRHLHYPILILLMICFSSLVIHDTELPPDVTKFSGKVF